MFASTYDSHPAMVGTYVSLMTTVPTTRLFRRVRIQFAHLATRRSQNSACRWSCSCAGCISLLSLLRGLGGGGGGQFVGWSRGYQLSLVCNKLHPYQQPAVPNSYVYIVLNNRYNCGGECFIVCCISLKSTLWSRTILHRVTVTTRLATRGSHAGEP